MRSLFALFAFAARMALMPHGTAKAGLEEGRAAYARADYGAALNELMPLAKAGNAHAQRMLGILYRQGQGVAKNAERALHWTQEAVKQGDAGAHFNLANMI
jgi:TPR repeat protein